MIDSLWRRPYQKRFVSPLLKVLVDAGVSPNTLTFAALVAGIAVIPMLAWGSVGAAIVLLLLSGYLDTLDGSLARATKRSTAAGAVFDIVSDRIVEFAVVMALYSVDTGTRALGCLLMLGSILVCITSFLVVGIFSANEGEKSFHYDPGLMERTEAFLFFGLMILLPGLFPWLAIAFSFLVALTALIRVCAFLKREAAAKTSLPDIEGT